MTFNELSKLYLKYVKTNHKYSSYRVLESRIRLYLDPFFKNDVIPLSRERQQDFKAYLNELKGHKTGHKRALLVAMIIVINFARNELNIENSIVYVKNFKKSKINYTIWNFEEFNKFIETQSGIYKTFFKLVYFSGARKGEILALTLEDLKSNNRISITKTYSRNRTTDPKTPSSNRIIEIPEEIYKETKALGYKNHPRRIFEKVNGTAIRKRLKQGCLMANLNLPRLHDFRHSHITMLLYEGITPQGIAHRVGHNGTSTLLEVYAQYLPKEERTIISKLEKYI